MASLGPTSTALELAGALRRHELSAAELLDQCLAAVDERNPRLNAVIWRNDEEARAAAAEADRRLAAGEEAPFLGVPLPIKDLTPVEGWPVTFGSRGGSDRPSPESELVVDALALRAGAIRASARTERHRPALHRREVLYGQRHTEERRLLSGRQTAVGLGGRGPGFLVVAPDHGVQPRVALVDCGQALVEQLGGRQL